MPILKTNEILRVLFTIHIMCGSRKMSNKKNEKERKT